MERIDGPMMMDLMMRKPWLMPNYAPCSPTFTTGCT